jgi:lysophospholipase L1-like esterase
MKKIVKIIVIILVVLLVLAAILLGFAYNFGLSGLHNHTEPKSEQIRVACVGDSITYGHGVFPWAKNNYPAVLGKLLGDEYHVANFGHSGATASDDSNNPYTKTEQYQLAIDYKPNILVIMLGSNDSREETWVSEEKLLLDIIKIVEAIRSDELQRVIVCTPASAYYTDGAEIDGTAGFDLRPEYIERAADAIRIAAKSTWALGVKLVDINKVTENHPEWFKLDGIHPGNDGARAIAEAICDKILEK